jgi:hypothetical protein
VVKRRRRHRRQARKASIVDEHPHVRIRADGTCDALEIRALTEIGSQHLDSPAMGLLNLAREGLETVRPTCDQDEVIAAPGEAIRIYRANAGRGARHHRNSLRAARSHRYLH